MIAISLGTSAVRSIPEAPLVNEAKKKLAGKTAQGIRFIRRAATIPVQA